MSDSYWARIRIGGHLPKSKVPKFLAVIKSEYISERPETEKELQDTLKETLSFLELSDGQASNGMFDGLEEYCRNNDLTYQRNSDQYGECEAEEVYWAPGLKEPLINKTDGGGNVVIDREEVLQCIREIREYLHKAPTLKQAPLHINSDINRHITFAQRILATGKVDPLDLLEHAISIEYPVAGDVPPLVIT